MSGPVRLAVLVHPKENKRNKMQRDKISRNCFIGNRDYGKWKIYKIIVKLEMTLAREIEFESMLDIVVMTNTGYAQTKVPR